MLTFFITTEQRRRAQDRAAELDISRSKPPGHYPYVWDNRQSSVKRWYDYGSSEDKIGTIYFGTPAEIDAQLPSMVKCTTEITQHRLRPSRELIQSRLTDPMEHDRLAEVFLQELLGKPR